MISLRRNVSRLAVVGISGAVVLGAGACTTAGQTDAASAGASQTKAAGGAAPLADLLPADLKANGTIKVASNVDYPPFEYYDTDNKTVIGVDKEIADAISAQLGVTLQFTDMSFDAVIPALEAKRFDMGMSAMSDTAERRQKVDFVDYFASGAGFLVKKGNPRNIGSLDDLCGLTAAIVKGTTEVADADAQSKKCQAAGKKPIVSSVYPGTSPALLAVENGRADVLMADTSSSAYIAKQSAGKFEVTGKPYDVGYFGIVFPKGADKLEQAIKSAVEAIIKDGTYVKILAKYGEEVGAIEVPKINAGS